MTTTIEETIEQYSRLIIQIVRRIVQNAEETRDICQETFLRFFDTSDRGETIHYPKAWLCRTALNLAIESAQRNERERDHNKRHQYENPEHDKNTIEKKLLVKQIRQLAVQLPERQREVFILRHFNDLPYADISAVVGCTPEAARVYEYHAVRKIRSWLDIKPSGSRSGEK